jgi:hypothetical protein
MFDKKANSPAEHQERNSAFLNDLLSSDAGISKMASEDINNWLRTYQRQDGVWRKMIPPTPVTSADFGEAVDTREPFIINTIIPKSMGATTVNFDTGTATTSMYADKYQVFLQRIMTPKYRIDKMYLAAYKGDLISVFKDLSMQDILQTEDYMGISLTNATAGTLGRKNEATGIKHYVNAGAPITLDSIKFGVQGLTISKDNINPTQGLVHRSFWWELIGAIKACMVGDRLAEDTVLGKTRVLEESLMGIAWRTALDSDLVPPNMMYIFASPEYCGDFLTYEDASVFTKVEDNIWFEMFAHETIGMSMPYGGCLVRVDFDKDAKHVDADWTTDTSDIHNSQANG